MAEKDETKQEPKEEQETTQFAVARAASWEFLEPPLTEDVEALLKAMPLWWGVSPADYIDYVHALSQRKNVSPDPQGKDYKTVWTLYMSVAGRIAAISQVAQKNDFRVDFEPEPNTPTGIPGFLEYDDRIVYREYCSVWTADGQLLGRKPGMAWVPKEGGSGAVASNRYEKVETSARGRSIAAWGVGVLPGSGVASLDEMATAADLARGGERAARRQARRENKGRDEWEAELLMALEEYQQVGGVTDQAMNEKVQRYAERSFNLEIPERPNGGWDFAVLKEGQVILFGNRMKGELERLKAEKADI
jgi:hypothetical protein